MRFFNIFMFCAIIIAAVYASPISFEDEVMPEFDLDFEPEPRVTCDLLGNEKACVLHCYLKGFRGGWCDSRKVCNCRR